MNLLQEIEKNKDIQKLMQPIIYSYKEKRDLILTEEEKEKFREQLENIKDRTLGNMNFFKSKTINNLEKNGIKVIESKNIEDAQKEIKKIVGDEKLIIKSKSNAANEINLKEALKDKEILETDLGDYIMSLFCKPGIHPVTPAVHITPKQLSNKIFEKFNVKIDPVPEKIAEFVREKLRSKIFTSKIGITGANVISSDGSIFILENEGNISLVSRVVDKHIIIASFDKIVETRKDAQDVVSASSIFASGQEYPVYVSIISGPSKTADIEKKLIIGAQGAKEVYLILVDNGRSEIFDSEFRELLRCINCGACVNLCPIYHQIYGVFGSKNFPGPKGILDSSFKESLETSFKNGSFFCTLCKSCYENCPVKINHTRLMKRLREKLVKNKIVLDSNRKMIENTVKFGNPFGKIEEGKTPKEMYCC